MALLLLALAVVQGVAGHAGVPMMPRAAATYAGADGKAPRAPHANTPADATRLVDGEGALLPRNPLSGALAEASKPTPMPARSTGLASTAPVPSADSTSGGGGDAHGDAHSDAHGDTHFDDGGVKQPYYTLLFACIACTLGVVTQQVLESKAVTKYVSIPYTPAMLVVGFILASIDRFIPYFHDNVEFHTSFTKWKHIDGHLLLFVFLPPLIFSDALALRWHTFARVLWQCVLLAGPGVLIGSGLFAIVAHTIFPYGWDWTLCLAYGAVMSATDPVAVVGLLNQLGASPALTTIIGGESLLNDGSAMVVWLVTFGLFKQEERDWGTFIAKLTLGSLAVGFFGGFIVRYILGGFDRLGHNSASMQTVVTFIAAYSMFYVAESFCGASGVLANVVMGSYLAYSFWPINLSPHTLHGVWHIFEWLYNTVLFTLTGLIIGSEVFPPTEEDVLLYHDANTVDWADMGWAFVSYIFAILIRAIVVCSLFPMLKRLGYGMSLADAVVATWGGLRGAVGLALALVMEHELHTVNKKWGDVIVIHVATVAVCTLIINAPTTAPLLRILKLTSTPEVAKRARKAIRDRVVNYAHEEISAAMDHPMWVSIPLEWRYKVVEQVSFLDDEHGKEVCKNAEQKVYKHTKAIKKLSTRVDTSQDLDGHEISLVRTVFYRYIKQSFFHMADSGQLEGAEFSVALALAHAVDTAADSPLEPLQDLTIAMEALAVPWHWRWLAERNWSLFSRVLANRLVNLELKSAGILSSILVAHYEAQKQVLLTFEGKHGTDFMDEVAKVVEESNSTIDRASAYLYAVGHVSAAGTAAGEVMVNAWQSHMAAEYFLNKICKYVETLEEEGVADHGDCEHLMHEIEHDKDKIQNAFHVTKVLADRMLHDGDVLKSILTELQGIKETHLRALLDGEPAPLSPGVSPGGSPLSRRRLPVQPNV